MDNIERYDWDYELSKSRVILLTGEICEKTVHEICTKLTILDEKNKFITDDEGNKFKRPIWLYINSYGGSIYDGLAIIDTMKIIQSPIFTVVRGKAMSMGAAIAVMGDHRYVTPNSRIMFHEASSGTEGKVSEMEESLQEAKYLNNRLEVLISERIGMNRKEYSKLIRKRDVYISAQEALDMNVVDEILDYVKKPIKPEFIKRSEEESEE